MNAERVLLLLPPRVPAELVVEDQLPLFQAAAWLRRQRRYVVDTFDAAALNATWKDVAVILHRGYDHVVLMNDLDGYESFARAVLYVQALAADARLVTFGRLGARVPGLFTRFALHAVVESGDPEIGVELALGWNRDAGALPGVHVRDRDRDRGWLPPRGPGKVLDPEELGLTLPEIAEIPYAAYDRSLDDSSVSGRELVVPIARGRGDAERRIDVDRAVAYIRASFATGAFDSAALVAPELTHSPVWTRRWCEAMLDGASRSYLWRCTTRLAALGPELVGVMAESGCYGISVDAGPAGDHILRRPDELDAIAEACARWRVELSCTVVLGESLADGTQRALDRLRAANVRIRPVLHTAYERLHGAMAVEEVMAFNPHVLSPAASSLEAQIAYGMVFGGPTLSSRMPLVVHQHRADDGDGDGGDGDTLVQRSEHTAA